MTEKEKKIAFLFPGQGAQYPGMGRDFYENFAIAKQTFQEADELLSCHFSKVIFDGSSWDLTQTKNSQMAIYITSLAICRTVQEQFPMLIPTVCAGLSLGEYTALTASLKCSFEDCLPIVCARGQYMNEACEIEEGTMHVVLGLDAAKVEEIIQQLQANHRVFVANLNCPGQVVIAGTKSGVEAASITLKEKGAKRCVPLDVSGAFHSGLMQSAKEKLIPLINQAKLSESKIGLVMNVPGSYVGSIEQMRQYLIEQVTSSVRWERGVRAMMEKGIQLYLEMGPGKALAGMNRKIGASGAVLSIEKVTDLEELAKQLKDTLLCNC